MCQKVRMPCKCGQPPKKRQKTIINSTDIKFRSPEQAENDENAPHTLKRRPCLKGFANVEIEQLILKGILK